MKKKKKKKMFVFCLFLLFFFTSSLNGAGCYCLRKMLAYGKQIYLYYYIIDM